MDRVLITQKEGLSVLEQLIESVLEKKGCLYSQFGRIYQEWCKNQSIYFPRAEARLMRNVPPVWFGIQDKVLKIEQIYLLRDDLPDKK